MVFLCREAESEVGVGGGGQPRFSTYVVIARVMGCLATVGATVVFCTQYAYNREAQATRSVTQGEIISSQVEKSYSEKRKKTDYWGSVSYRYTIEGKAYTVKGYYPGKDDFHESSALNYDRASIESALTPYVKGAKVEVYYNPAKPEKSTLTQPRPHPLANYLAPLFFAALGLGLVIQAGVIVNSLWQGFLPGR